MDFVEICNVCSRKVIIKTAKRIFNSDKICRSYCDFYFGVTFFGTHCMCVYILVSTCIVENKIFFFIFLVTEVPGVNNCPWLFGSSA